MAHRVPGDSVLRLDGRSGATSLGSSLAPSPEPLSIVPKAHRQDWKPNGAVSDSVQGNADDPEFFVVELQAGAAVEELESVVAAEAIGSASELVAVGLDDVVVTGASILSASAAFAVTES